jgi:hypothetical protein
VNTVLGIVGMTMSALNTTTRMNLDMEDSDMPPEQQRLLTGETRIAAETTFINACATLDDILKDKSRWSMEQQDRIELERQTAHKAQMDFFVAQRAAAAEISTPHFRYRASIARATDGDWIAFVGDPEDLANAIVGVGKHPQAALDDFDNKFAGNFPPAVSSWLENREQSINDGLPSAPFPKINYEQSVDTGISGATDEPEAGGEDGQRDSGDAGDGIPADNG